MEKLAFWDAGGRFETVGSMDEIQGMMDNTDAYRVLWGCIYDPRSYQELGETIGKMLDEKTHSINCSPLEAAMRIDAAEKDLPIPEDIFCFLEKAYLDGVEQIKDDRCMFLLGRLYSQERYGHIDYQKAAKWFAAGAEAGDGRAEQALGKLYLLGLGVPQDYPRAYQYLTKWALINEDHAEALYLLGEMFRQGLYVEKDLVQAYELYQKSWEAEDACDCIAGVKALLRLADYKVDHIGEKQSCHHALVCYQRAESECYDYLLSHPQEAALCLERARSGQVKARKKLKKFFSKP